MERNNLGTNGKETYVLIKSLNKILNKNLNKNH